MPWIYSIVHCFSTVCSFLFHVLHIICGVWSVKQMCLYIFYSHCPFIQIVKLLHSICQSVRYNNWTSKKLTHTLSKSTMNNLSYSRLWKPRTKKTQHRRWTNNIQSERTNERKQREKQMIAKIISYVLWFIFELIEPLKLRYFLCWSLSSFVVDVVVVVIIFRKVFTQFCLELSFHNSIFIDECWYLLGVHIYALGICYDISFLVYSHFYFIVFVLMGHTMFVSLSCVINLFLSNCPFISLRRSSRFSHFDFELDDLLNG